MPAAATRARVRDNARAPLHRQGGRSSSAGALHEARARGRMCGTNRERPCRAMRCGSAIRVLAGRGAHAEAVAPRGGALAGARSHSASRSKPHATSASTPSGPGCARAAPFQIGHTAARAQVPMHPLPSSTPGVRRGGRLRRVRRTTPGASWRGRQAPCLCGVAPGLSTMRQGT